MVVFVSKVIVEVFCIIGCVNIILIEFINYKIYINENIGKNIEVDFIYDLNNIYGLYFV